MSSQSSRIIRRRIAALIPNFGRGGAEIFAIEMARRLQEVHDITIYYHSDADNQHSSFGVTSKCIGPALNHPEELCRLLKADGIEVIWSHMSWDNYHVQSLPLLKQQGFKVILTEHSSFWYPYFCEGIGIWNDAEALKIKAISNLSQIDAVACVSNDSHRMYAQFIDNSTYIPNYPNPIFTHKPRLANGSYRVGNVSSFSKPVKRIDLLYRTYKELFSRNSKAELHIAGQIDLVRDATFRKCNAVISPQIYLHGEISNVRDFYSNIDVFCLTSQLEGMPTVVLEAAAMGVPTVSFNIPGIDDIIINNETGIIVDFLDCSAMAEAINCLFANPSRLNKMSNLAREFVISKFTPQKSADSYIKLIEHLFGSQANSASSAKADKFEFWDSSAIDKNREISVASINKDLLQSSCPTSLPADWNLQPLVSFLIPCFNAIETIDRALSSIRHHYFFDWECLVLDDCSTDGTYEYLISKYSGFKKFRIIRHDTNLGLYEARSTLSKNARGYYIAFLDSDDTIDHAKFELALMTCIGRNADIIDTGLVEHMSGKVGSPYPPPVFKYGSDRPLSYVAAASAFTRNKIKHSCCGKIYKSDIFAASTSIDHGLGRVNSCEDLLRNTIIFTTGASYTALSNASFYNYIRKDSSMSLGAQTFQAVLDQADLIYSVYQWCYHYVRDASLLPTEAELIMNRFVEDFAWMIESLLSRLLASGQSTREILKDSLVIIIHQFLQRMNEGSSISHLNITRVNLLVQILLNNIQRQHPSL